MNKWTLTLSYEFLSNKIHFRFLINVSGILLENLIISFRETNESQVQPDCLRLSCIFQSEF